MKAKRTIISHNTALKLIYATLFSFASISTAHACPVTQKNWEAFGGIGYTNYLNGTANGTFSVSNIETDSLTQSSGGNRVGYTAGFDRMYSLSNRYIQAVSMGFTLRYDPSTLNGQVYQFQDPASNNYTYQYKVRPITELLEGNIFFPRINKIHTSPFIILGVGMTQASLNYQETPQPTTPPIPSSSAASSSAWKVTEDLAIGAGFKFDLKKNYFMKAQYLYQYRGDARLSNAQFIQGVPINLDEQSVDVIAGYKFK